MRRGVNSQATLQAGTGAAPAAGQGMLKDAGPRGSCGIASLGLGIFFQSLSHALPALGWGCPAAPC